MHCPAYDSWAKLDPGGLNMCNEHTNKRPLTTTQNCHGYIDDVLVGKGVLRDLECYNRKQGL